MLIKVYVNNLKPVVLKSSENLFLKSMEFISLRKTIEYILQLETTKKITLIIFDVAPRFYKVKIKTRIQSVYYIHMRKKEVSIKYFNEKLVTRILRHKGFFVK